MPMLVYVKLFVDNKVNTICFVPKCRWIAKNIRDFFDYL